MVNNKETLLEVKNLKQYFNEGKKNEVRAIENISFDIYKGCLLYTSDAADE